jgi:hypothetical protein
LVPTGQGATQVKKSSRLDCATQFLPVSYDVACSPNVSVGMAWISLGSLPFWNKFDNSSLPDVVEISRVAWHAALQSL